MNMLYLIVDRYTGEIMQEFGTEKDVTMYIRNIVLPSFPQYLLEMDVHIAKGNESEAYRLYDFAVQTKVIKASVKQKGVC